MNHSPTAAIVGKRGNSQFGNDTVYQWSRGSLLMLSSSLLINGEERASRRPTINLLVATRKAFSVEFDDGSRYSARALVTTSRAQRRRRLDATDSGLAMFDFSVVTPEYVALHDRFGNRAVTPLDDTQFEALTPMIETGLQRELRADQVKALVADAVKAIVSDYPERPAFDPRIATVLHAIDGSGLEDLSLSRLAERVCLSPERLRHLFKQQVGYSISYYARTAAVWKALELCSGNRRLTDIAHEAGFHDLAHFSHAFAEMYGYSPSRVAVGARLRLV